MDSSQALLFVLVAFVMGWFALGVVWNIRRGNAVLRWMQSGLPRLGEKTTLRWLGSSAVELGIGKARPPFRRVELLLVLEPRDVPWFWLFAHLRGRRDMLIVRGQLLAAPPFEYDLLAPGSWSEQQIRNRSQSERWEKEVLDGLSFAAPVPTRSLSRQVAPVAVAAARRVDPIVWRLSARREFPQFELHVPLPDPNQAEAAQFFNTLCTLAEEIGKVKRDA
ncbi:MAG: hypothetical protein ACT4QE_20395 [Anaerolineales bacterium]